MSNIIEVKEINSVMDLLKNLHPQWNYTSNVLFRGQSDESWSLTPKLFRRNFLPAEANSWRHLESELISRYRALATSLINLPSTDYLGTVCLAQHHGLPTRLLDWTSNPLVACFFAVEDVHKETNAAVWMTGSYARSSVGECTFKDMKSIPDGAIISPRQVSPRISAQQAYFIFHQLPEGITDFIPLDKRYEEGYQGIRPTKFIIPSDSKIIFKLELDRMGIDYYSVFPDLDGLSRKLEWEIERNQIALEEKEIVNKCFKS